MKKENRLLKGAEFKACIDVRRRVKNESFTVFAAPNALGRLRVGISVSRKVGKAHIRVRVRRQIRACFDLLDIFERAYDIVVVAHPGYLKTGFAENRSLLESAVLKLTFKEVKR